MIQFAKTGTITHAARHAGVCRETVRKWRRDDPVFAARFDDADLEVTDLLEESAMTKALRPEGAIMNIFLLKSRNPEKYRDNALLTVAGAVPLTITLSDDKGLDAAKPTPDA